MLKTKLKITSVAVTAALLSGCFASSGGTVAPLAAVTPPVVPLVVTTPPVTTQCAANAFCIPDMSAISIPVTLDASGNLTSVGAITTLGATTATAAMDPTTRAPTSVTITGGVSTTVAALTSDTAMTRGTAADGQQVTFWRSNDGVQPTSASPTNGMQYSGFGMWNKHFTNVSTMTATAGGWAGGDNFTMTMPATGSATYAGHAVGSVVGNNMIYDINGNLSLTANFAASTITGSMTGMTASDTNTGSAAGLFNNVALAGTINGNAFTGTATAGALPAGTNAAAIAAGTAGTSSGHFYGPAANEVTGLWGMSGGGVAVGGSFGAKQ